MFRVGDSVYLKAQFGGTYRSDRDQLVRLEAGHELVIVAQREDTVIVYSAINPTQDHFEIPSNRLSGWIGGTEQSGQGVLLSLDAHFASAQAAYEGGESVSDMEAAFVALVEFVRSNPHTEDQAEQRVLRAVQHGGLGPELIEFCIHAFRWSGVVAEASTLASGADPRRRNVLLHYVEAGDDAWAGASMYAYFSVPPKAPTR